MATTVDVAEEVKNLAKIALAWNQSTGKERFSGVACVWRRFVGRVYR
jgi:hypothetical protein